MEKYIIKGAKKLLSLTRTKIRLAEESDTVYTKPTPLPLVKLLFYVEIRTIEQAKKYRDDLVDNTDFSDSKSVASAVIQAMDIIEGVKYGYEPEDCLSHIDEKRFKEIESQAIKEGKPVNILLMTKKIPEGLNIFVGYDPPKEVVFLSCVPTSLATFLNLAFNSDYFSQNLKLKNINSILGHKTLILNTIHFSFGEFGVELKDEGNIHSNPRGS